MTPPLLVDTSVISWYLSRDAQSRHRELVEWFDEELARAGLHISAVTMYELRRGVAELLNRGQGTRKAARVEMILRQATVYGLDGSDYLGWKIAADLWARANAHKPSIAFSDGDLLITATAIAHGRALVTVDEKLRRVLKALNLGTVAYELPVPTSSTQS
jgi:predicted nucleic acid-binding protein